MGGASAFIFWVEEAWIVISTAVLTESIARYCCPKQSVHRASPFLLSHSYVQCNVWVRWRLQTVGIHLLVDFEVKFSKFLLQIQLTCSEPNYRLKYRGVDKSVARPGRKQARKHVRDARDFKNIEARAVKFFFFSARQGAEGNSRNSDKH